MYALIQTGDGGCAGYVTEAATQIYTVLLCIA